MKKTVLAMGMAAATFLALPAAAQNYQVEAGVFYANLSPDMGPSDSLLGIGGEFHFAPVETANRPLAEAAFLGRSSNVAAFYATVDDADVDLLGLGGEFYVDNLYFAADYTRVDAGATSDDYGIQVGFLPMDGLRITLGYDKADLADVDTVSLNVKYVAALVADSAINLEGSIASVDDAVDTKVLNLGADYYFSHAFSAGVTLAYVDNDIDSDTTVGVRSRYFFTPVFSGEASYTTNDFVDTFTVGASLRF